MAAAPALERLRDPAELLAIAEPLEPRTTHLVDALLHQPRRWRQIHVARDGDGRIVGAVVVSRLCLDRWFALPLVLDPSAAPAVAARIDRSKALLVLGFSEDVEAVQGLLRRGNLRVDREHTSLDVVNAYDYGVVPDIRTRLGVVADHRRLVELYEAYELDYLPSVRRLSRDLARDLRRDRIVVMEEHGELLAAFRVEAATRQFFHWSHQTVHPDHRGRHLGTEVFLRGLLHAREHGVSASWARHPTNPTPPSDPNAPRPAELPMQHDRISQIRLQKRIPALRKPWRALELLEGRRRRRPKATIDTSRWERAQSRWSSVDMTNMDELSKRFEETRDARAGVRRGRR